MKKIVSEKYAFILGVIFSLFTIIGTSFFVFDNLSLIYSSILMLLLAIISFFILTFVYYLILKKLFVFLDNFKIKKLKLKKTPKFFKKCFETHPFVSCFVIIFLCWLPYIIAFYPVVLSNDPSFQIKQFYGIDNKYSYYVNLIDEDVIITNHHPVAHTILLGGCAKIGEALFNDINMGLFMYTLVQLLIFISSLSISIVFLRKWKLPNIFWIGALLMYSLVPVFPFYGVSAVKDTIYTSFMLIYVLLFYLLLKQKEKVSNKEILLMILIMFLLCISRNNGIYIILLSFPFLFKKKSHNLKKLILIFMCVIINYGIYDKVVLPYFKITPSSSREALSIPFQQTARYVKYHSKDLTLDDIKNIDKILNYDTLATRYKPELSDPVKNEYNKNATKPELINYFKTWFNGFTKHPFTYVEATLNNTYGYFYPLKTKWYIYYKYDEKITKDGLNYHYNSFSTLRGVLAVSAQIFPYIIGLGLIVNIAFNFWLILTMLFYLIRKKANEWRVLLPSLITILICFASPANCYFRYAMPYIFIMPLLIGIFLDIINKKGEKNE